MAFRGWPAEALDFFEGLEADNSKAYWQDHREVYDTAVRAPMEALLAELAPVFGAGKIFRPYRDTRFSRDKSPYKTNIAATLERGPYLSLSVEGLGAGAGYYEMGAEQLARYREAVADDAAGAELDRLATSLRRAGVDVGGREELKTAPRGYPKDHPRVEYLRHKGLIAWRSWPVAPWLGTAKAKAKIVEFYDRARPLLGWLDTHVGPA
ncbi:MAG TPA: DUF2461 domain-containing protein [Acidimicrobiales bacterium]|nr:DUF2461 domain-containing protein [Acidimicrobiales bacterium]